MIRTIKPYGGLSEELAHFIFHNPYGFYVRDDLGIWKISEQTYNELKNKGIKDYGEYLPIQPV